jgi:hypothetical protein
MSERRRTHRTEVEWCAKILANQSLQRCVVRDVSFLGARLAFSSTADVPDDFELALHQMHMQRRCSVVWRSETEIGVKFSN